MENRLMSMRFTLIVCCVCCATTTGETIRFDPPSQSIDVVSGVRTLTFDVYLQATSTTATFGAVDVIIGSNTLVVQDVALSDDFLAATDGFNTVTRMDITRGYTSAIFFGGFSFTPLNRPFLLGTVIVDAGNVSVGSYTIDVNSDTDGGFSSVAVDGVEESLIGSATVTIFTATTSTCQMDTECDDTLACTSDSCVGGTCTHTPIDGCIDSTTPPADGDGTTDTTDGTDTTGGSDTIGGTDSTGGVQVPVLCGATGMIPLIFTMFFLTLLKRKTL